jgi:hypothetical protein
MDGWRMAIGRDSTCWKVRGRVEDCIILRFGLSHVLGYLEFRLLLVMVWRSWFVVRFGISRVWLLLVMHVSSSQDRMKVPSPTGFAGALRSFCDSSFGKWTEEETDNMKIQKQFENPNSFCTSL